MNSERWVTWVELYGPNSEPVYMFVPESTAVAHAKDLRKRLFRGEYDSDAEAILDFLTVNWAYFVEKPKGIK